PRIEARSRPASVRRSRMRSSLSEANILPVRLSGNAQASPPVPPLPGPEPGETILMVNPRETPKTGGRSRGCGGRPRRARLLLFTIAALLYVGMQSRVAQRLPTRSPEELLTSFSDPVKFPPPEERMLDPVCTLTLAAKEVVSRPPARLFRDTSASVLFAGER